MTEDRNYDKQLRRRQEMDAAYEQLPRDIYEVISDMHWGPLDERELNHVQFQHHAGYMVNERAEYGRKSADEVPDDKLRGALRDARSREEYFRVLLAKAAKEILRLDPNRYKKTPSMRDALRAFTGEK